MFYGFSWFIFQVRLHGWHQSDTGRKRVFSAADIPPLEIGKKGLGEKGLGENLKRGVRDRSG